MVTTIKASHIVKPAAPTPTEFMYLSECDQTHPLTHTPVVYFYRPTTNISLRETAQILKDSLSKALVRFYPLAGRLSWTNGGRVELHCNSMGALLVEAESDLEMDDLGDFRPTPEVRSLYPSVDFSATPIHKVPMVIAQITKFRCGGISFGTGISHSLVDGQSAGLFLAEWAKIARGEQPEDDDPFLDRKVLMLQGAPLGKNSKLSDFYPQPLLLGQSDNLAERNKAITPMMLKLSKEQIVALRSKANNNFSRIQVVCAHIWRCVSLARGLKPEQETVLFLSVDFRNRINSPLPKKYLGNAIMVLPVTSTAGEILSNSLSYAAGTVKAGIESVTDEYVRSYLHCINSTPDVSNVRHSHTGCDKGTFYGNPNLRITSWGRLPIFGLEFGWGEEVFAGPGTLACDGNTFVIPSRNGDGSFLVPLAIQVEHAVAFNNNFYQQI